MQIEPGTPSAYVLATLAMTFIVMGFAGITGVMVGGMFLTMGFEVEPARWGGVASVTCSVATVIYGSVISYRDYHFDPNSKR